MKLTSTNYFSPKANREYFSVSQWKSFKKCPNMALAEIRGKYVREETTALLVGSYVDAYFDNELELFKATHPALFKKDGTLKAEYIQAEQIIERIKRDRLMMKYLTGGERQVIMTGEIEGVPIKIKIDTLHPDKIVDGKVTIPVARGNTYRLSSPQYPYGVRFNTTDPRDNTNDILLFHTVNTDSAELKNIYRIIEHLCSIIQAQQIQITSLTGYQTE
jgi:hypothetical protein